LTRASQYVPPFEYKHLLDEKGVAIIDPKIKNDKLSGQGLLAVPVVTMPTKEKDKDLAFRVHGGVMVNGDIRRDASVNLINLRAITTPDKAKKDAIRPYLLGLSLIALLYEQDFNLRQGCLLVPDTERTELRKKEVTTDYGRYPLALVRRNGKEEELNLLFAEVLDYAKKAAEQFIVNQNEIIVNFRADIMKAALKQAADEPEGNES
jgi:hypothetical protein